MQRGEVFAAVLLWLLVSAADSAAPLRTRPAHTAFSSQSPSSSPLPAPFSSGSGSDGSLTQLPAYTVVVHAFGNAMDATDAERWAGLVAALTRREKATHNVRIVVNVHIHAAKKECAAAKNAVLALVVAASRPGAEPWSILCAAPLSVNPAARRAAVLDADVPAHSHPASTYILVLEDVAKVSPLLLAWVDYSVRTYLGAAAAEQPVGPGAVRLVGSALYSPAYNEVEDRPFNPPSVPYLLQFPPAWGSVYPIREWANFRSWCAHSGAAGSNITYPLPALDLPRAYSNRWPSATSWRKWLARYLAQIGGVLLYPPGGASFVLPDALATVIGHPPNANEPADRSIFLTPLVPAHLGLVGGLPFLPETVLSLTELPAHDLHHQRIASAVVERLCVPVRESDGCTIILSVYSRITTLHNRLVHLTHAGPAVRKVIVIWNNVDVKPPVVAPDTYPIPVVIKPQANNSLNNRFAPQAEIATECVMAMDDDADIAYPVLELVSRIWHSHFFDRAVGIIGRRHYQSSKPKSFDRYVYKMNEPVDPSIVLPTGMAFHRDFLAAYQALPAWLLEAVDTVVNCEDLLFNMLVTNTTGHAPVVISAPVHMVESLSRTGLSSRTQHSNTRSWCLNKFASAFPNGDLPLRCSRAHTLPHHMDSIGDVIQFVPIARNEATSFECDITKTDQPKPKIFKSLPKI